MSKVRDHDMDDKDLAEDFELLAEHRSVSTKPTASARWVDHSANTGLRGLVTHILRLSRKCMTLVGVLYMSIGILVISSAFLLSRNHGSLALLSTAHSTASHPFAGAFSRFPRISDLPPQQRRITMVGMWIDDKFPSWLRHFFYTAQLNADTIDLLMINLKSKPESRCLDFVKENVDITWAGNVKYHCLENSEFVRRHIDHLCSKEYGWDCTATQYSEVAQEFDRRKDKRNHWRPFTGYILRDLFQHPENPFWGWIDTDVFIGNFARYPFNLLSQLSILTGTHEEPSPLYMAGQLTTWNFADAALGSAWKHFPELRTVEHFTKHIDGEFHHSDEERIWSYGYLRSTDNLPGTNLSYGFYPALQGDDYFDKKWNRKNSEQVYIVSGREILLVSTKFNRQEIETLIAMEREDPIDDLGGIGWTTGEDGSSYLMTNPELTGAEARGLASARNQHDAMHQGLVESLAIIPNCSGRGWDQCIHPHPLTQSKPPMVRTSLMRFADQKPGYILRRIERDHRARGYERKLIRHTLKAKYFEWWDLPPFEISEDLVLRYNSDFIEVFRMGSQRDKTLYFRKEGEKSIG